MVVAVCLLHRCVTSHAQMCSLNSNPWLLTCCRLDWAQQGFLPLGAAVTEMQRSLLPSLPCTLWGSQFPLPKARCTCTILIWWVLQEEPGEVGAFFTVGLSDTGHLELPLLFLL
jgi:hypothetical protein